MEYGANSEESNHPIQHEFPVYGVENHQTRSTRDWFSSNKFAPAEDNNSDLMEVSQPANQNDYDHDRVSRASDSLLHHYQQQQQQQTQHYNNPSQTLGIGISNSQICNIEREHMFDKVVTPSDVGKLNRLVIPKQHAEKYFPLDSSTNEKGLLLNFEDLTGKPWRFRYSYWNSSQSYVMTKGWSRFVKEKKLDAGDIVSFQRGVGEAEKHRLFIDWRRRPITTLPVDSFPFHSHFYHRSGANIPSWSSMLLRPPVNRIHPNINFQIPNHPNSHYYSSYGGSNNYNYNMGHHHQMVATNNNNASVVYLTDPEGLGVVRGRGGSGCVPLVFESVPVVQGKKVEAAAAPPPAPGGGKRLRLFGVNMECPDSSDFSTSDEFEMLSSSSSTIIPVNSGTAHHQQYHQYPSSSSTLLQQQQQPPTSTRNMMYNGTPVSNKGKTSMSLDLDI